MENCKVSFFGGDFACGNLPKNHCVIMAVQGVPDDGNLEIIQETFKDYPTAELEEYTRVHTLGGPLAERCKASPAILKAINLIIREREKE